MMGKANRPTGIKKHQLILMKLSGIIVKIMQEIIKLTTYIWKLSVNMCIKNLKINKSHAPRKDGYETLLNVTRPL